MAAGIHIVLHILGDGPSQLKVAVINAVGYRVFVEKRNQILSDLGKVI